MERRELNALRVKDSAGLRFAGPPSLRLRRKEGREKEIVIAKLARNDKIVLTLFAAKLQRGVTSVAMSG